MVSPLTDITISAVTSILLALLDTEPLEILHMISVFDKDSIIQFTPPTVIDVLNEFAKLKPKLLPGMVISVPP